MQKNCFMIHFFLFKLSLEYLGDLDAVYDLTIAFKIPWLPLKSKQLGPSLLGNISLMLDSAILFATRPYIYFENLIKLPIKW